MSWLARIPRNFIVLLHDALMAAVSFVAALYLRLGSDTLLHTESYLVGGTVLFTVVLTLVMLATRLYRRVWRYVALKDLADITQAAALSILIFYLLLFQLTRLEMVPRSVPLIHLLVLLALLCGTRFVWRALKDRTLNVHITGKGASGVPVLLVGANDNAEMFIRESARNPGFAYRVVALVDNQSQMAGRSVHRVRVYGAIEEIPTILRKLERKGIKPQRMIITDTHIDGTDVRRILDMAEDAGISVARLPRLTDFASTERNRFDIRPIDVEDVLGRPQTMLDRDAMRHLVRDKVVLVTGAGGSIGGELVRQIAAMRPSELIMLDNNEYHLYQIDAEVQERQPKVNRRQMLADVRDKEYIEKILHAHKPHIVFHAAAIKHVPIAEAHAEETVLTNVSGTRHVADACVDANVPLMVQISTDKAVRPTNVMGACKRIGETYCQALGEHQDVTRFITVRFGNVLGSTGSVIPLFQKQLQRGGPLTVTHPDMTRYFMTIREAVQLVLQAAALGEAEKKRKPRIYVLDMGEPIKIEHLALQMIRLAGLEPYKDIGIDYIGLRPGEKLHEELFYDEEALGETSHAGIHLGSAREVGYKTFAKALDSLHKAATKRQRDKVLEALRELVPDYTPQTR